MPISPRKPRPQTAERTRTPSAAIETVITDAAKDLLATEGPTALSIRRIAGVAGVAPMSVYNRFGSKQGIIDALFIEGFQKLQSALSIEHHGTVEEQLVALGRHYRAFAIDNPTLYSLMFLRGVPEYEPSDDAASVASNSFLHLVSMVEPWIAAKEIEPGDPVEIAQHIWETCHGVVSLELNGIGFLDDIGAHLDNGARRIARGLVAGKPAGAARKPRNASAKPRGTAGASVAARRGRAT